MARASGDAAAAGRQALSALRRRVTERVLAALDQQDPELLQSLAEFGVVRREWVDDPHSGPMTPPPTEVVERVLERAVERRPSLLNQLGLSAVQLLSTPAGTPPRRADQGRADRLVVMFTDLEGISRYTARKGDDAAATLLTEHHHSVAPIIRRRGGRVVKRLGDGLLLTYPAAEAAVLAGLELVATEPGPLRLRAGLHQGEVLVFPDDVLGHVVNVAARVTELAKGGQVMLTSDVRQAIGPGFAPATFTRVRQRQLKGLDAPVGLCRAEATLSGRGS